VRDQTTCPASTVRRLEAEVEKLRGENRRLRGQVRDAQLLYAEAVAGWEAEWRERQAAELAVGILWALLGVWLCPQQR
jgi:hypothetical protein